MRRTRRKGEGRRTRRNWEGEKNKRKRGRGGEREYKADDIDTGK